jgi:hypothetical protein
MELSLPPPEAPRPICSFATRHWWIAANIAKLPELLRRD